MNWRVDHGDCLSVLAAMPEASVDAVVTDPPYGLEFMGKEWDRLSGQPGYVERGRITEREVRDGTLSAYTGAGGRGVNSYQAGRPMQEWHQAWAAECLRALKPGGHLLAFGGTRTYHRLAVGIEDAGFEIRDCIAWMYGSGFPKSLNLDGDRQGWGTALKPAHEPVVVARKPLVGTVANTVAQHGTGAINIDGCRVRWRSAEDEREAKDKNRHADFGSGARENAVYGEDKRPRGEDGNYDAEGRWPANVVLDAEAGAQLDAQTGNLHTQDPATRASVSPARGVTGFSTGRAIEYPDAGGASRFFYCAKADGSEREAGLGNFEHGPAGRTNAGRDGARSGLTPRANVHPTVKPIDLMRWLVRLVTPPEGIVLDPFTGSGTTGCAAVLEGFDFIGIEREAEYVQIARARIGHWEPQGWQMEMSA